jgi:hypothetical protein
MLPRTPPPAPRTAINYPDEPSSGRSSSLMPAGDEHLASREPPHQRAESRSRPEPVLTTSIAAWPAVGGGLLVGMVVPHLHGAAPLRRPIKSAFIRIDAMGGVTVTIPYVGLEEEATRCVAALVATELSIPPGFISVDCRPGHLTRGGHEPQRTLIVDICPASEFSLSVLGATARSLLLMAAEEKGIAVADGIVESGQVSNVAETLPGSRGDLAVDAALFALPRAVTLRSGLRVALRGPGAGRRAT